MSRAHKTTGAWRYLRLQCFHRDGYRCVRCGSGLRLECDHKVALSEGGEDVLDNLRTLCRDCHIADTRERFGDKVAGQDAWSKFATSSGQKRRKLLLES